MSTNGQPRINRAFTLGHYSFRPNEKRIRDRLDKMKPIKVLKPTPRKRRVEIEED